MSRSQAINIGTIFYRLHHARRSRVIGSSLSSRCLSVQYRRRPGSLKPTSEPTAPIPIRHNSEVTCKRLYLSDEQKPLTHVSQDPPCTPADQSPAVDEDDPREKEKLYDFYLSKYRHKTPHKDAPGTWLQSLSGCESALPAILRERPLDIFSGDSRDLKLARRCLESVLATLSANRSRNEQRKELNRPDCLAGSKALRWLLRIIDEVDLSAGLGFLRALVHCLVAEGPAVERDIWQWLENAHIPAILSSKPAYEKHSWRGAVLLFLAESQAFWANDGCLDQSIKSFEHACGATFDVQNTESPLYLSKSVAGIWIYDQLYFNGASKHTNVDVYNSFVRRLRLWTKDVVDRDFKRAELLRVHPLAPTALPSLAFVRDHCDRHDRSAFVLDLLPSKTAFGFLVSTARLLNEQGYLAEAHWVLDFGRKEMPEQFMMKTFRSPKHADVFGYESRFPGKPYSPNEAKRRQELSGRVVSTE